MKKLTSIAMCVALALSASATTSPKREFRSTWLTTYMNIDWPSRDGIGTSATAQAQAKKELIAYLDAHKDRNFTGVCFHVRSMADAMYKSKYEPWSQYISGTRGVDPGWDPLAFAVEECHKRGLECYAWLNPYRHNRSWAARTTPQDKEWEAKGWFINQGTVDQAGMHTSSNEYEVFNPALPEVRQHIINVFRDVYMNYRIDGILCDDYFYPNNIPANETALDYKDFVAQNPGVEGTKEAIGDWRRENVNLLMRQISEQIDKDRPDLRFGLSPAGIARKGAAPHGIKDVGIGDDWQYNQIYSDPVAWLADGSIDFISPQIYWFSYPGSNSYTASAPYDRLAEWWYYAAEHYGRHAYISIAPYRFLDSDNRVVYNNEAHWKDLSNQISLNRKYDTGNAPGIISYSSKYMDGPLCTGWGDYLEANSFQGKSLVPVVTWKDNKQLTVPDAKLNGNKISWTGARQSGTDPIMRYTVYAVPQYVTKEQAADPAGDGIAGQYLREVVYGSTYTIPMELEGTYWYAVCAYDGYGFESEPAYLNYSPVDPPAVAKEDYQYPAAGDITISNLWMRSIAEPFSNIEFENNGVLNRGIAIAGDKLYLSHRSTNGGDAESSLKVFDLNTGFVQNEIALPDIPAGASNSYPCNDIITDNLGNLYITNMTLNAVGTPLTVYSFDPATNATALVATCKPTGNDRPRIDHAAVHMGTDGKMYVFATVSSTAKVLRWTVVDGQGTDLKTMTAKTFVPKASNFGVAPRIHVLSPESIIVDGGSTHPARYDFNTGELKASYDVSSAMAPKGADANGLAVAGPDGKYLIFPSSTHSTGGHQFNIVDCGGQAFHSASTLAWTVPNTFVGEINSTTMSSPIASKTVVSDKDWEAYVAIYATGNALGVYKIKSAGSSAAAVPESKAYSLYGRTLFLAAPAEVEVYNLQGIRLARYAGVSEVTLPAGLLIVTIDGIPYRMAL